MGALCGEVNALPRHQGKRRRGDATLNTQHSTLNIEVKKLLEKPAFSSSLS
jgi:hypothetical protein